MSGSRHEQLPLDVLPVVLPALGACLTVVVCFFYDVGFLLNHQTHLHQVPSQPPNFSVFNSPIPRL